MVFLIANLLYTWGISLPWGQTQKVQVLWLDTYIPIFPLYTLYRMKPLFHPFSRRFFYPQKNTPRVMSTSLVLNRFSSAELPLNNCHGVIAISEPQQ